MQNIFTNNPMEVMIFLICNFVLVLILFILNISTSVKLKKLRIKYNKFMNGLSDRNIEELLVACINKINDTAIKSKDIENHVNFIERNLLQCIQKVGMVRYNAFENMGSDLSFSIALLDGNDTGIILSGIYSRDSSSTYAKPVLNGKSKYALSAEEFQALDIAKKMYRERLYTDNE